MPKAAHLWAPNRRLHENGLRRLVRFCQEADGIGLPKRPGERVSDASKGPLGARRLYSSAVRTDAHSPQVQPQPRAVSRSAASAIRAGFFAAIRQSECLRPLRFRGDSPHLLLELPEPRLPLLLPLASGAHHLIRRARLHRACLRSRRMRRGDLRGGVWFGGYGGEASKATSGALRRAKERGDCPTPLPMSTSLRWPAS